MIRIYIICEGESEEVFVKDLLVPEFQGKGIQLTPLLIGQGGSKGGDVRYSRVKIDARMLLADRSAYCTTFFDYYGLPSEFPGKEKAKGLSSIEEKAATVCDALAQQLSADVGSERIWRFIPYVQMHEFEALLFSDPGKLAQAISQAKKNLSRIKLSEELQKIRAVFDSPEEINDSEMSAPSKRVISLVGGYEKVTDGIQAAQAIGLAAMRRECALFDAWLKRLQALPTLE